MTEQAEERINLTEQELFDRLTDLMGQQLTLAQDIKQLKADNKFHKKNNPKGIALDDIKLVSAAAKLEATAKFEEFTGNAAAVKEKFEILTSYNE